MASAGEPQRYAVSVMSNGRSTTKRKVFFKSKPQLYVLASTGSPHQRTVGDWIVRESYEPLDDRTLPDDTVSYSIWIETEVSSPEEIWAKRSKGFELAYDLNRVWTYVCGQPINVARLGLVAYHAPAAWTTNAEEVEKDLQAAISGLTYKEISIQTRHWTYCPELPLAKALDVRESYETASDFVRTLIELHYLSLTSVKSEARFFFFAKALEIVRALLPSRTNRQKQKLLPVNIASDLHKSLHWLFDMANTRSNVRHVVQKGAITTLLPQMSVQEGRSFQHDADLVIRTVVCMQLGHEPFLVIHGKPNSDFA